MKVLQLLRDVRPFGRSGEIIKVSPDHSEYLLSLGMAVSVGEIRERVETPVKAEAPAEKPEPKAVKKTAKKK